MLTLVSATIIVFELDLIAFFCGKVSFRVRIV